MLSFRRLMSPDGGLAIGTFPADSLRFGILMASSTDDCWKLAGECGRWAEEAQESATRLAFRQMAKVWAQLAFGQHSKSPADSGLSTSLPLRDTWSYSRKLVTA